jgi:hypothetical protein
MGWALGLAATMLAEAVGGYPRDRSRCWLTPVMMSDVAALALALSPRGWRNARPPLGTPTASAPNLAALANGSVLVAIRCSSSGRRSRLRQPYEVEDRS